MHISELSDSLRHVLTLSGRRGGIDVRTLDGAYSRAARALEASGLIRLDDAGQAYVATNAGRETLGLPVFRIVA